MLRLELAEVTRFVQLGSQLRSFTEFSGLPGLHVHHVFVARLTGSSLKLEDDETANAYDTNDRGEFQEQMLHGSPFPIRPENCYEPSTASSQTGSRDEKTIR